MSLLQSISLGIIQGITEFLPISSSGHLIIAREFFGLSLLNTLSFDVLLHLSTLLAIILYYRALLKNILINLITQKLNSPTNRIAWVILFGTIPAVLVGFFLGDILESYFRNPSFVAVALIIGCMIFLIADRVSKTREGAAETQQQLNLKKGIAIGIFQSLALIPGVSRSGITISGGLFFGLPRTEAISFAFLLAIPAILGAALKTVFEIVADPTSSLLTDLLSPNYIFGFIAAFVSGFIAIKFLVRYLSTHSFMPFIIYRLVLAGIILLFL